LSLFFLSTSYKRREFDRLVFMDQLAQWSATALAWGLSIFGEHPSWDVLLTALLVGLAFFVGMWGRGKTLAFVIAGYVVVGIVSVSAALAWIHGTFGIPTSIPGRIGVIAGLAGIVFAIVQYGIGDTLEEERGSRAASVFVSASALGMLTVILFQQFNAETVSGFSVFMQSLFMSPLGTILWIVAPIFCIGVTRD